MYTKSISALVVAVALLTASGCATGTTVQTIPGIAAAGVAPTETPQAVAVDAAPVKAPRTCQTDRETGSLIRTRTICASDDEASDEHSQTESQMSIYGRGGGGISGK